MLKSLMFRLLRLMITSVLCSLPIYIGYVVGEADNIILFLSFISFVIAICIDSYRFSSAFWKIRDYYLGQLLPIGIYCITGFLTCLIFPPVVFNRLFLPLRLLGCFGMNTRKSVVIVSIIIILIATGIRFAGAIAGRSNHNMFVREDDGAEE